MKLDKIILQLTDENYRLLSIQLKDNQADKFLILLKYYREGKLSEVELLEKLDMNYTAFYTLKSRLFDKIQTFLYKNTSDNRIELLQNVANIEFLIYKTPRETAIGILQKLESELIEHDMPNELIIVYKALKKLHINSKKYYTYSQLYNKHVAFNLAQDKAEELLSVFCKTQGEYFLSRNKEILDVLVLYKKEIVNVCRLYQSHHLTMYKNILLIHFAIFSPVENEMQEDSTVEELLQESLKIIEAHPEDRTYKHLKEVIYFLYFEYYHQLGLNKNASKYFEKITAQTHNLLLSNHCSFVHHFLISKIEYAIAEKKETNLYLEDEITEYEPNIEDVSGYVLFSCYKAMSEFYAKNYTQAIYTLITVLDEISFKKMLFVETEIKALLALSCILCNKHEQANSTIRNMVRKISDDPDTEKYESALVFIKILKIGLTTTKGNRYKKIVALNNAYNMMNKGVYRFLPYLKLDDDILTTITTDYTVKASKELSSAKRSA
jgi:hypothetical protein